MSNRRVRSSRGRKSGGKNKRVNTRSVKDVFLIVTEGTTEKNYFEMECFRPWERGGLNALLRTYEQRKVKTLTGQTNRCGMSQVPSLEANFATRENYFSV